MNQYNNVDDTLTELLISKINGLELEYDLSPKDLMEDELAYYYPKHNYHTGSFEDYELLITKADIDFRNDILGLVQDRN